MNLQTAAYALVAIATARVLVTDLCKVGKRLLGAGVRLGAADLATRRTDRRPAAPEHRTRLWKEAP